MLQRKKLGEIFLEHNLLSSTTIERVVAISKKLNKRFGTVLEEMGLVLEQNWLLLLPDSTIAN